MRRRVLLAGSSARSAPWCRTCRCRWCRAWRNACRATRRRGPLPGSCCPGGCEPTRTELRRCRRRRPARARRCEATRTRSPSAGIDGDAAIEERAPVPVRRFHSSPTRPSSAIHSFALAVALGRHRHAQRRDDGEHGGIGRVDREQRAHFRAVGRASECGSRWPHRAARSPSIPVTDTMRPMEESSGRPLSLLTGSCPASWFHSQALKPRSLANFASSSQR